MQTLKIVKKCFISCAKSKTKQKSHLVAKVKSCDNYILVLAEKHIESSVRYKKLYFYIVKFEPYYIEHLQHITDKLEKLETVIM